MKPAAKAAGVTTTDSEPSKERSGIYAEGGATAPTQKTEQALQDECVCVSASGTSSAWTAS